jgi:tetratricopeptide (TPR) repeat protein
MSDRSEGGNRGPHRPSARGRGGRSPAPGHHRPGGGPKGGAGPKKRKGGLGLARVDGDAFELVHPRCVREMELDYAEGIELWEAGDPEAARDALRYALQGCGDNLWVHVALGRIALRDGRDPALARGHFGYAYELARRAIPPGFSGLLPKHCPANRPFYDAVEGLASCYEAMGRPGESAKLRDEAARLAGNRK